MNHFIKWAERVNIVWESRSTRIEAKSDIYIKNKISTFADVFSATKTLYELICIPSRKKFQISLQVDREY